MTDRDNLCKLITELAVVPGRVILSSGQEADYYIDLRRVTLHHAAAPLIGRVMLDLTADWDVAGRWVIAVEDTSTTGVSVLIAVDALRDAAAEVIGVAVIVDRGAGDAVR